MLIGIVATIAMGSYELRFPGALINLNRSTIAINRTRNPIAIVNFDYGITEVIRSVARRSGGPIRILLSPLKITLLI
jgi:hypothetical protein|tara:strand:- start:224 stop:454 length:231 start_codon:yes stop_codon:yes gene_type:complete